MAILVGASFAGISEGRAALGSLVGVAIYYLLLWAFGGKISEKVDFNILKL